VSVAVQDEYVEHSSCIVQCKSSHLGQSVASLDVDGVLKCVYDIVFYLYTAGDSPGLWQVYVAKGMTICQFDVSK